MDQPKDAQVMAQVLKTMGVESYDPKVVNQMLDFVYRYVSEVLTDARDYMDHAARQNLELDDVRLAIQSKVNQTFTQPPPKELLMDLARARNGQPMPIIPNKNGFHLPDPKFCLLSQNWQWDVKKRAKTGGEPEKPAAGPSGAGASSSAAVRSGKKIPIKLQKDGVSEQIAAAAAADKAAAAAAASGSGTAAGAGDAAGAAGSGAAEGGEGEAKEGEEGVEWE
eukprot:tig00000383_g24639.t1